MVGNPPVNAAGSTPQALIDLSGALVEFSDALDAFIKSSGDPFTPAMQQLRNLDTHIAADAALIARLAVEELADDVRAALSDLNGRIKDAKQALQNITDTQMALSLVAAVLSVAVGMASGNPLGAAQSVLAFVQVLSGAVAAASA